MVTFLERTTQRSFVEALARAADLEPTFVSVPRERIRKAGGQLIGRDLFFGEYLDLPPHTEIVEKAPRLLGVAPTPLERALELSELRRFCDPLANRQVCDDRSKAATSDLFRFRDHLLARSRKRFGCSALRVTEQLGSNRTELRTDVRVDHLAGFGAGVSMTTIMNVAIGPRRRDARNHAMRLRPFD